MTIHIVFKGYLSPEVLKKEPYGKSVDIWACGKSCGGISLFQNISFRLLT